jgi:PEP-CTERM motif
VLTGGITSDDVLFNFDSGDYSSNTGGATLLIGVPPLPPAPSLLAQIANPTTTATYLDPNRPIEITNFDIIGRVFGGDRADFLITDSEIMDPVPEPSSLALLGAGIIWFGVFRRRRGALHPRS